MLSLFVEEKQETWDEHLPYVLMAYSSAQHESTKLIPNMLMLGREVSLSLDFVVGPPGDERDSTADLHEYAEELRSKMESAHEFTRSHLGEKSSTPKETRCSTSTGDWL